MSRPQANDTRNIEWKSNNIGSKLLNKMGWKHGEGVGKRYREEETATEGLRVKKRTNGLGLGAKQTLASVDHHNHADAFASALKEFQKVHDSAAGEEESGHPVSTKEKKKKKKKSKKDKKRKKELVLPTNKTTHSGIRSAKFKPKTSEDLKGIFAGAQANVFGEDPKN